MTRRSRTTRAGILIGTATTLSLLSAGLAYATVTSTMDAVAFADAVVVQPGYPASAGTLPTTRTGGAFALNYPCIADDPNTAADETSCPMGISTTPMAGFPTQGDSFGVLSTGDVASAPLPNDSTSTTKSWGVTNPSIGPDVYDYQIARIDLGAATASCLSFDFRFLSEEYPEFVDKGFNDAFIAQLNIWGVTIPPGGQGVNAPGNFAAGAGDDISVDSSGPSAMAAEQAVGTTYDGATLPLVARQAVTPGSTNTLFLTLFDQGDSSLDSAVFVDNLRYEDIPAAQCKSLALDPAEGATGVTIPTTSNYTIAPDNTMTFPVTCSLPPGPVSCNTSVAVDATTISPRSAAARRQPNNKATALIAATPTPVSIAGGTTANVQVPLTAAGQAFVKVAKAKPAKLKKKAKKLKKKAKKLAKKARAANGKKAKKLAKKAKKLKKKAKKLKKQAKKLKKAPLFNAVVTFTNPSNNATSQQAITISR